MAEHLSSTNPLENGDASQSLFSRHMSDDEVETILKYAEGEDYAPIHTDPFDNSEDAQFIRILREGRARRFVSGQGIPDVLPE